LGSASTFAGESVAPIDVARIGSGAENARAVLGAVWDSIDQAGADPSNISTPRRVPGRRGETL
jgi:hypothetical protein